jgi:UDPglucose 6-dehydrogenase
MRITVVGTGYVGLVTACCLADNGNDVIGCEIDPHKLETLQAGRIPIHEAGLSDILVSNMTAGRIRFTADAEAAVRHGQIIFLTIGTPPRQDGSPDMTAIEGAVAQLIQFANEPKILVIKSTVPIGTGDRFQELVDRSCRHPVKVVSNPEFLKEGAALDDFLRPDRVIIGSDDPSATEIISRLYRPFVRNQKPILVMSRRAAEMSKYAANCFLAMRISFINEIAGICEKLDVNVDEVRMGIGSDSRIGHHFLYPSPGYGGSCFPKDVQALSLSAKQHGAKAEILDAVHSVNQRQQRILFDRIVQRFGADLSDRGFAVWGVTFKARTDDIRESAALRLIDLLLRAGARVAAHDPEGLQNLRNCYGDRIAYAPDPYAALREADGLAIVTEWNVYRSPDFLRMRSLMKAAVVFDGRNLYDLRQMQEEGIEYYSIGRRAVVPAASGEQSTSASLGTGVEA